MDITSRNLRLYRNIIYKTLGINFTDAKDYLLKEKLKKLLSKSSYSNLDELYLELQEGNEYAIETLIRYMTTNHTYFNRESDHFKYLIKDIQNRSVVAPVIWCAASSTGEEVYSIAIELLENGIIDYTIMATDIDNDVLKNLKSGIYSMNKIKSLSPTLLYKYFKPIRINNETQYKINQRCKKNIIIKKVNLIENIKFVKEFDYIFCRNVMIYFDEHRKNIVIDNLLKNLKNNGLIFTGHSESLLTMPVGLINVYSSVYKRKDT